MDGMGEVDGHGHGHGGRVWGGWGFGVSNGVHTPSKSQRPTPIQIPSHSTFPSLYPHYQVGDVDGDGDWDEDGGDGG